MRENIGRADDRRPLCRCRVLPYCGTPQFPVEACTRHFRPLRDNFRMARQSGSYAPSPDKRANLLSRFSLTEPYQELEGRRFLVSRHRLRFMAALTLQAFK